MRECPVMRERFCIFSVVVITGSILALKLVYAKKNSLFYFVNLKSFSQREKNIPNPTTTKNKGKEKEREKRTTTLKLNLAQLES